MKNKISHQKIAFIINPASGLFTKAHLPRLIRLLFPENKFDVDLYRTKSAGEAFEQAKKYICDGVNAVVAVGGDGTVNEVARALSGTDIPLGILPSGSGNGLARHLGIPIPSLAALKKIKRFKTKEIDVCTINDRMFFCTAGVGYDAMVTHAVAGSSRRGPLMYVEEIVFSFFDYKPEHYKITIDGEVIERDAFLVTFANSSQWGNNALVAPHADISDGLIDVVIVTDFDVYKAPKFCISLFTKRVDKNRYVEIFKCKHVVVERDCSGAVHFDGEPCMMPATIDVQIRHKNLKVLV